DNWHESFTKFHAASYLTNVPVRILMENNKTFYYDSWNEGIRRFLLTVFTLLIVSSLLTLIFLVIDKECGTIDALYRYIQSFRQRQPFTYIQTPSRQSLQATPMYSDLTQRKINHQTRNLNEEDEPESLVSNAPETKTRQIAVVQQPPIFATFFL